MMSARERQHKDSEISNTESYKEERFLGRAFMISVHGRPIKLVYKETQMRASIYPDLDSVFESHGFEEVGDGWDLLRMVATGGAMVLQLPEPAEVGVRFCKPGKRQYHSAKLDAEDSDIPTSSRPTVIRQINTCCRA